MHAIWFAVSTTPDCVVESNNA